LTHGSRRFPGPYIVGRHEPARNSTDSAIGPVNGCRSIRRRRGPPIDARVCDKDYWPRRASLRAGHSPVRCITLYYGGTRQMPCRKSNGRPAHLSICVIRCRIKAPFPADCRPLRLHSPLRWQPPPVPPARRAHEPRYPTDPARAVRRAPPRRGPWRRRPALHR
jgi:hypothetical protein